MRRKKTCLSIILMLLFISVVPVFAAEGRNSVLVDFSIENHTKGIDGGEFTIVKVLNIENGTYSVNKAISDKEVSADAVLNDPENTAKTIANKKPEGISVKTTDTNGNLSFDGLEDGVYLIYQTNKTGNAENYNLSAPFFIELPQWEGNELRNTITVYPKTTKVEEPEKPTVSTESTPSAPVKTGDETNITLYVVSMIATLGVIGGAFVWRKVRNNNGEK